VALACAVAVAVGLPAADTSQAGPVKGGEIVAFCPLSHRAKDDPIVFPRRPGKSHSHDFYGNRSTNPHTTLFTLDGSSTNCAPRSDRSAYWVPTVYDDKTPVRTRKATFYYRADNVDPRSVSPYPRGLRVIAGNAKATGPVKPLVGQWGCQGTGLGGFDGIPSCPAGADLELLLRFPDCWDGRRLDSPDHKRHMAYSTAGRCPSSHRVAVPRLEYKIRYASRGGRGVALASGPGYTVHGDFFNAWAAGPLARRIRDCLHEEIKCGPGGRPL